jgi:hypothetical protein
MVEMIPAGSSTIESIGYDPGARELHVRFVRAGVTYVYLAVDSSVFRAFLATESKGQFFYEHVRDAYSYRQLE